MNSPIRPSVRSILLAAAALGCLLGGCTASQIRDKQLTEVARDWSMTLRASQVLPIYPMSEDLLPGDVFLTQARIGEEPRYFREKGFLPLDNLIGRLMRRDDASTPSFLDAEVERFYGAHFRDPVTEASSKFPGGQPLAGMPVVGFPSYTVKVSRRGGGECCSTNPRYSHRPFFYGCR